MSQKEENLIKESVPTITKGEVVSHKKMYEIAEYIANKELSHFENPGEIFLAMQVAFSLGMREIGDIFLAINNMYFLKGRISLWGDLPMAVIKKANLLESIEEFFIDKDHKQISLQNKNVSADPICAVCRIKRKDETMKEFYLTLGDLTTSGNYVNGQFKGVGKMEIWKNYPKIMWAKRLRRWALASVFSDILKCISMEEDTPDDKIAFKDPIKDGDKGGSKVLSVYGEKAEEGEATEEEAKPEADKMPKIETSDEEDLTEPEKDSNVDNGNPEGQQISQFDTTHNLKEGT